MVPLALVPTWLAAALWTGASVGALAAAVVVVRRALDRPAPGWLVALITGGALALEPVWQNLTFGQLNLFLMLAVLVDLVLPERRWSGVLVGHRGGRQADTPRLRRASRDGGTSYGCRSGSSGLRRDRRRRARGDAECGGELLDRRAVRRRRGSDHPLWPTTSRSTARSRGSSTTRPRPCSWLAVAGPLALAVLVVAARWWRRGDRVLGTCLGAVAMLLASPISWSHHWVWAVPVALVLWERSRWAAAAWTAVFVARPVIWPPYGAGPRVRLERDRAPRRQRLPPRRPRPRCLGLGHPGK